MGSKRKRGGKGKKGGGKDGKEDNEAGPALDKPCGDDADAADRVHDGGDAKRQRTGDGKGSKQKDPRDVWREEPGSWTMENAGFEAYYKRQGVCPENEWDKLLETLRTGLPAAIRVTAMRAGSEALNQRLLEMRQVCGGDPERECYAPDRLTWYPDGLGWHWKSLERKTIKKDSRHAQLKNYLAERERRGLITRQEVVSMLPPLFLGVEPHHLVLDMCAAPGSKTTQIIELMHTAHAGKNKEPPTGLVMANELQWSRANMLAHQVSRLGSPCAAIVNMDAQFFPDLWDGDSAFRFDRVLCDVPCSGDGTMRKTPYIWKSWTRKDGLGLHLRQLNILYRGLDLLKVGGRLVYSTCSLNPMEDESVVAAALARHGDALVVVPRPAHLPGVNAASGLEKWVVPNPQEEAVFFEKYEDVPDELRNCKCRLLPSMFPPGAGEESDSIRKQIREGCCRMLPHLMDTGGFFVACFEKRAEFKPSAKARRLAAKLEGKHRPHEPHGQKPAAADSSAAAAATEAAEAGEAAAPAASGGDEAPAEEEAAALAAEDAPEENAPTPAASSAPIRKPPILKVLTKEYHAVEEALGDEWQKLCEFYGLDTELLKGRVYLRGIGHKKQELFLQSEGAARLLRTKTRLPTRMVLTGVLAFQAAGSMHIRACPWRMEQQGVAALCAVGLNRRLLLRRPLLRRLLVDRDVPLADIHAAAAKGDVGNLESIIDASGKASSPPALRPGSVALQLLPYQDGEPVDIPPASLHNVALVANIGDDALELACSKAEAAAILEDIDGQPTVDEILGAAITATDAGGDADEEMGAREKDAAVPDAEVIGA